MTTPEARARRFMLAIIAAGAALVFAALVLFFAIGATNDTAVSAQSLARQIQIERVRNIRSSCEAQNARNHSTVKTLDALISKVPRARVEQARASRTSTILLIDALAPVRNCAAVVRQQTPGY